MSTVIGRDKRGDTLVFAQVDFNSDRVEITGLGAENRPSTDDRRTTLSVPDGEVIMKPLILPPVDPTLRDDALRFELAQTQLEDDAQFHFDFLQLEAENTYLGFIYRRNRLDEILLDYGCSTASGESKITFKPRSLALGQGYLTFCEPPEGELVCLIDITNSAASVCFLYRRRIVDLAGLQFEQLPSAGNGAPGKVAADLKGIVNFRLAALMDRRIGVPLSSVVLCGNDTGLDFSDKLGRHFPVGISRAKLRPQYAHDDFGVAPEEIGRFLVSLGLTVY